MEFISTNRGGVKVLLNGHTYIKQKPTKATLRWYCCHRNKFDCPATLITDLDKTRVITEPEHSHNESQSHCEAAQARARMIEAADISRAPPNQIVVDTLHEFSPEVVAASGSLEAHRQAVRRVHRRKRPRDPKEMKDIPYPLPADFSENLLYDNGNETGRILLFGSKEGLQRLCYSDQWFADGTHSTASRQFAKVKGQLFVVRVPIGKVCISVAYALLPSHKTEVYVEALTQLKNVCFWFAS